MCKKRFRATNNYRWGQIIYWVKGALTEQYILQELKSIEDLEVTYWANDDTNVAEADFLIQYKGKIIPIEVKSKTNLKAKSLKSYIDKFKPNISIRTSLADYKKTDVLPDIPLYMIEFII